MIPAGFTAKRAMDALQEHTRDAVDFVAADRIAGMVAEDSNVAA